MRQGLGLMRLGLGVTVENGIGVDEMWIGVGSWGW